MTTNVKLLLKGSMVLFGQEGQPQGSVRILKVPPPKHELSINYRVKPPEGEFGEPIPVEPIKDKLKITVNRPTEPNITLRQKDAEIDRLKSPVFPESVNWFVDFENDELYDVPIAIKPSGFKQVLTFNSGELFNDAGEDNPSYNFLHTQAGIDANYTEFGYVAIRIGVLFSTEENVVFTNGRNVVFDSATEPDGTEFEINVINDTDEHGTIVTDANHYYKGVGPGIPAEERILFASVTDDDALRGMLKAAELRKDEERVGELRKIKILPPIGPEAACFPAYLGKTLP